MEYQVQEPISAAQPIGWKLKTSGKCVNSTHIERRLTIVSAPFSLVKGKDVWERSKLSQGCDSRFSDRYKSTSRLPATMTNPAQGAGEVQDRGVKPQDEMGGLVNPVAVVDSAKDLSYNPKGSCMLSDPHPLRL